MRNLSLLVIAASVAILAASYAMTRRTVTRLTGDLFREVSRQSVLETRSRLQTAVPALEMLGGLMAHELAGADNERIARVLLEVLRANPSFAWVSWSDEYGSFTGVWRSPEGRLRVNRSVIAGGKTRLVEHEVAADGGWTVVREEADTGYDPRKRPFYEAAKAAGRRAWTAPYVFYEGIPGITCAQPHFSKTGRLLGVLTIDFDLNGLSSFMKQADLSPHGKVFLFTPGGKVIAHPSVQVVNRDPLRKGGELVTTADIPDPVLRSWFASALESRAQFEYPNGEKSEQFLFRHEGKRYIGSYNTFEIDLGLQWVVGAVAPESDFRGRR